MARTYSEADGSAGGSSHDDFRDREIRDEVVEQELEDAGLMEPPDGGWGWVVVMGSFLANIIVDGIIFTAGSGFQPQWQEYFSSSSSATAWTVSLLSGCYLLAATGFLLSQFVTRLPLLYLTFGIMGGIGFGLVYLPSIVIVSYYFKKRRAFATGLAVCGSGIGTFAFAPLIKILLDNFTWQQCLLIVSGISLNGLVSGAVYRSLEPSQSQIKKVEQIARRYHEDHMAHPDEAVANGKAVLYSECSHDEFEEELPISPHVAEGVAIERFSRRRTRTVSEKPFMSVMELHARQRRASMFAIPEKEFPSVSHDELYRLVSRESVEQLNRPLSRMDIFYPGSVLSLHQRAAESVTSNHSILKPTALIPHKSWIGNVLAVLHQMLDFSLLRSPCFLILAFGGFLTLCGFFVPFIYLPRISQEFGHGKSEAMFLVSILGITNIVARIVCGWLSDNPKLDALMIHNVALTVAGVATVFVPFYSSYWMLAIYCVVFGFGTACFASLRSIICVELLGLHRLTSAFGFLLLFMGIAAMVGSPIAGALYDITGTYDMSFYVTGSLVTLSGLIGFPLKCINKWEKERLRSDEESSSSGDSEEEPLEDHGFQHRTDSFKLKPLKRIPTEIPEVPEEEEREEEETSAVGGRESEIQPEFTIVAS